MTNKYERSLLNPLDGPSVGVPALVGVPSRKFRVKAFGTVVANTGVMNIQWMPHAALANDVDCVRVTGGTVTSDGKIRSNSIFSNSNFGDGKNARLVSARLRVYAQEAVTNGVLVAAACPYRTVLAESTVEEIVGRIPSDQMVVCDPASEICNMNYIPKSSEERDVWLTDVKVGPIPGRVITDTEFPSSHVVVWNGVLDERYMGVAQELRTDVLDYQTVVYKPTVNLNRVSLPYNGPWKTVDHYETYKTWNPMSPDGVIKDWSYLGGPTQCLAQQVRTNGSILYFGLWAKFLQDHGFSAPAVCDDNFTLADLQLDQESSGRSEVTMMNPDDGWLDPSGFTAPQNEDLEGDVPEIGDHFWWYTAGSGGGQARVCLVVFRCVPHVGETFDATYKLLYDFASSDWRWVYHGQYQDPTLLAKPLYTISHKCLAVHRAASRSTSIYTGIDPNSAEANGDWTADDPFTYLSCAQRTVTYPVVQTSIVDVPVIAARNAFAVEVTANFEVIGTDVVEGATMTPPAGHVMQISARGPCFVQSNERKEQVLDKVDRIVGRLRKAQRLEDVVRERMVDEGVSPDLLETAAQADAQQRIASKELADVGKARKKGGTMKDFFRARKPR